MKNSASTWMIISAAVCLSVLPTAATAQTWAPEQLEVWGVIQAQWDASMQKDETWPQRFLHEQFQGWDNENPTPRDRDATQRWNRYGWETSTALMQQLHPIGIVVVGNTAVAHYVYSTAAENRDGERETTHGRFSDILVRDGGTWRFLAWHGGDDPTDD